MLPECADLQLLQGARWLVAQQTASPASASAAAPAAPRAAPTRAERPQGPARPRNTRVVLPRAAESEVPSWFFEKTGAEIKAAFLNAVKRREESQVSNWRLRKSVFGWGLGGRFIVNKCKRQPTCSFAATDDARPAGASGRRAAPSAARLRSRASALPRGCQLAGACMRAQWYLPKHPAPQALRSSHSKSLGRVWRA